MHLSVIWRYRDHGMAIGAVKLIHECLEHLNDRGEIIGVQIRPLVKVNGSIHLPLFELGGRDDLGKSGLAFWGVFTETCQK